MTTEPYDLRSNIKGKPGSQGTLFQVKDKGLLNPAQRWPRGYTPERHQAVNEALRAPVFAEEPDPYESDDGSFDGDEDAWRQQHQHVAHQARPRVVQAIARSTVPTEHLAGLKEINDRPEPGTSGTYWPKSKTLAVDMNSAHSDPTEFGGGGQDSRKAESTLIHEIGHHVDFDDATERGHSQNLSRTLSQVAEKHAWQDKGKYQEKPNRSGLVQAENKVQSGVAEASADNYMVEHYRTHGRNPQPITTGRYEENFTPELREKRYPGYNDVRPPTHLGPQFSNDSLPGLDRSLAKGGHL